ncbi:MAG: citrate lyase subunit beta [Candidatus Heimdallarchaeota archaeon]|nr:citrate lyase subunit beta [Candidatus Heimdallarchaeota archaeon]
MTSKINLAKERLRRSRLYIPGNNPAMIQDAIIYGADSLILDLEDSISIDEKDSARFLVRNALLNLDFGECEITVRINAQDTKYHLKDLEEIIPAKPDCILIPKTETIEEIIKIDEQISRIEKENDIPHEHVALMPIIESAKGVLNVEAIASGPRVVAIGLGGEDLTADIGARRTKDGRELEYISSKIILACAANKIQAIDTVYTDINDSEGLFEATVKAIEIGFQGKSVIHPSQIETVHKAFIPTDQEVERAEKIVNAYKDAKKKGLGVVSVDGRMVDIPVVRRSEKILKWAKASK